jgi:hypothetical protein
MFALPVTLVSVPNAEVLASPVRVAFASALIVTETAPNVAVIPATAATALPFTPGVPKADVAANPVRVIGAEPSPHSS